MSTPTPACYPLSNANPRLPSHFVGGASEMIVCANLLRRGFPVYRACTFVCEADLIASVDRKLYRIEVRTAKRYGNGYLAYSAPSVEKDRYDVLAVVDQDWNITYLPDVFSAP